MRVAACCVTSAKFINGFWDLFVFATERKADEISGEYFHRSWGLRDYLKVIMAFKKDY